VSPLLLVASMESTAVGAAVPFGDAANLRLPLPLLLKGVHVSSVGGGGWAAGLGDAAFAGLLHCAGASRALWSCSWLSSEEVQLI
jgi:hypothetical protein